MILRSWSTDSERWWTHILDYGVCTANNFVIADDDGYWKTADVAYEDGDIAEVIE